MERDVKHNLNNVFSTIITYADLLMQDLDPESAQHKFAKAIFQSGVQAMEAINAEPARLTTSAFLADPATRSQKQLLIVDDQPDILAAMQIILEQSGYRAGICTSAAEMDAALQGGEMVYDLVILDESMPKEQGHEIALRLSRDYPDLPVIMVTGHRKEDILLLTSGISCIRDIVEKSDMITELVTAADRVLL